MSHPPRLDGRHPPRPRLYTGRNQFRTRPVHFLFLASRTEPLSVIVRQLKTGSNLWLQEQRPTLLNFHWQNGYGAFSVSQSAVEDVRDYILRQREHHCHMTFQEEYRKFLTRHEIEFDERYVWD